MIITCFCRPGTFGPVTDASLTHHRFGSDCCMGSMACGLQTAVGAELCSQVASILIFPCLRVLFAIRHSSKCSSCYYLPSLPPKCGTSSTSLTCTTVASLCCSCSMDFRRHCLPYFHSRPLFGIRARTATSYSCDHIPALNCCMRRVTVII